MTDVPVSRRRQVERHHAESQRLAKWELIVVSLIAATNLVAIGIFLWLAVTRWS
jgi:hypothetical protein